MDATNAKVEPKRSMGSFFHFSKEQRKLSPGGSAKEMGNRWRALLPEEKMKYVILAQLDKDRYIKESLEYDQGEELAEIKKVASKAMEEESKPVNKKKKAH